MEDVVTVKVRVHPHRGRYKRGLEDCVSITPHPGSGAAYAAGLKMRDVHFVVHQSGFRRMLEEGKRNVHAWGIGELEELYLESQDVKLFDAGNWAQVEYDFRNGRFVIGDRVLDKTDVFRMGTCIGRTFEVLLD